MSEEPGGWDGAVGIGVLGLVVAPLLAGGVSSGGVG